VIRQTGVYHKLDLDSKTSLVILVNAVPNSVAHRRVIESFSSHQQQMQLSPLWLHNVIHASYLMKWWEYVADYEKRLLQIVGSHRF
jgi:hypothetical protein